MIIRTQEIDFHSIYSYTKINPVRIVFSTFINQWGVFRSDGSGFICLLDEHLPNLNIGEKLCIRNNKWVIYTGKAPKKGICG